MCQSSMCGSTRLTLWINRNWEWDPRVLEERCKLPPEHVYLSILAFGPKTPNIVNRKKTQKKIKNTSQILVLPDFEKDTASSCAVLIDFFVQKLFPKPSQAHVEHHGLSIWISATVTKPSTHRGAVFAVQTMSLRKLDSFFLFFVSFAADLSDAPGLPVDVVKAYLSVLPEVSCGVSTMENWNHATNRSEFGFRATCTLTLFYCLAA